MSHVLKISPTQARRLAVTRQRLAGQPASADADGIMEVMRHLGCVQLDPISTVARSHLLVLWSRIGQYDPAHLDHLLWRDRRLFEYWAHCASIVLTEHYPIHNSLMRQYAARQAQNARALRVRQWVIDNLALRRMILGRLRQEGPLFSRELEEDGIAPEVWVSSGWTSGRNVSRMLDVLWMQGKIMVTKRAGLQKAWDIAERCLPEWAPHERLSEIELVRRAAQISLRALGVATPRQIERHFIRGRYPKLTHVLADLEACGRVERVHVAENGENWDGDWYVHAEDITLLEKLAKEWRPRTTLLSPFDNLICDRIRTRHLFSFDYSIEIYTPAAKRKYGYYVLAILHGDRLVGRLCPRMDRQLGRLTIEAIYAERGAPETKKTSRAIAQAIEQLGVFLGAREIVLGRRVPAQWASGLNL